MSLNTSIKTIQNIMRKDAGVDGDAQRISQLTWLLFLKIYDAKEEEIELLMDEEDEYRSPIPEELRWRNWAADDEGITGDELLDFVNNRLFPELKELRGDDKSRLVRSVFEDTYNYMKSGTLLRAVINEIQKGIRLDTREERHQMNDIYEKILRDLQSAGNAGEFYTPRAVTRFIVEMVNPQLGEQVLDAACGTGGFL
ncbi:MAG: SAM-dependent DNA methyltransferase, partial [Phaeodactylibacter sp.]|nr:SAM-dependent DNA methyltransferase [Phaeodactylibacter sp.]